MMKEAVEGLNGKRNNSVVNFVPWLKPTKEAKCRSLVIHKSGQKCWWCDSRPTLKSDQISGVMHKGVNKVIW